MRHLLYVPFGEYVWFGENQQSLEVFLTLEYFECNTPDKIMKSIVHNAYAWCYFADKNITSVLASELELVDDGK